MRAVNRLNERSGMKRLRVRQGTVAATFLIVICTVSPSLDFAQISAPMDSAPQPPAFADPRQELNALYARARELGMSPPPRRSLAPSGGSTFEEVMPAVVDLIDSLKHPNATSNVSEEDIRMLRKRASDLLIRITQAERSPRVDTDPVEPDLPPK
jgi:hypothetical protein